MVEKEKWLKLEGQATKKGTRRKKLHQLQAFREIQISCQLKEAEAGHQRHKA